jgi:hypothetical protein
MRVEDTYTLLKMRLMLVEQMELEWRAQLCACSLDALVLPGTSVAHPAKSFFSALNHLLSLPTWWVTLLLMGLDEEDFGLESSSDTAASWFSIRHAC